MRLGGSETVPVREGEEDWLGVPDREADGEGDGDADVDNDNVPVKVRVGLREGAVLE